MSFRAYIEAGWSLCALERGKKAPTAPQWNTKPIAADAADGLDGAGLLHALSGTCAIDIDQIDLARPWLAERGVDIDALLSADDAVQISSGRPGRAKLLYRMKRPLRTFKPKGSGLELRCATVEGKSTQDVLPPSIHPDTKKPYEWAGGLLSDWRALPSIPAPLLAAWRGLDTQDNAPVAPRAEHVPIDLARLRKAASKHSPDCAYDEWLNVGMKLHDGTGGAQEGFNIWCDWSRKVTRIAYPGDATLKSHWLSFESQPGKRVATGESLVAELPAEAEDFPVEPNVPAVPDPKALERKEYLDYLVKRFVFVVNSESYFDTETHSVIGDKAIRHMATPYMPKRNGRETDPVDKLMRSRTKTIVSALGFHPGEGALFTFRGQTFANTFLDQSPTPIEPMADELARINWLFNRIEDAAYRQWLLQFFAHMVQRPAVKIRSAPLIWSDTQGNGKSTLVSTIPRLLVGDRHYVEVTSGMLNSDFNDYLVGKWHVTLAEFRAGTRGEREAISKKVENWIADDVLAINPKGKPGYIAPNHLVITASTNKEDAASIDNNDRKWAIYEMRDVPAMTEKEKTWIFEEFLNTPRAPAVLRHFFLGIPISGFDPHADALHTDAREQMIKSGSSLEYELLLTAFEERVEPLARRAVFTREVGEYVRRHCPSKPSNDRVGKLLCKPPFNGKTRVVRAGNAVYRVVVFDPQWETAPGKDLVAYISGDDIDLLT